MQENCEKVLCRDVRIMDGFAVILREEYVD